MAILIDGYNLLHASGVFGDQRGADGFRLSRQALLNVLGDSLSAAELPRTTIVFDAADAPPGLPAELQHRGMKVIFARDHADADSLIEELIEADNAPQDMTIVSSDHRLQRAARRRRADSIDSERWWADLLSRVACTGEADLSKPEPTQTPEDVAYWLEQFDDQQPEPTNPDEPFPPDFVDRRMTDS